MVRAPTITALGIYVAAIETWPVAPAARVPRPRRTHHTNDRPI
jgi:hypothetical protein